MRFLAIIGLIGMLVYFAMAYDFHYRTGLANQVQLSQAEQRTYWSKPECSLPTHYTQGLLIVK